MELVAYDVLEELADASDGTTAACGSLTDEVVTRTAISVISRTDRIATHINQEGRRQAT